MTAGIWMLGSTQGGAGRFAKFGAATLVIDGPQ